MINTARHDAEFGAEICSLCWRRAGLAIIINVRADGDRIIIKSFGAFTLNPDLADLH